MAKKKFKKGMDDIGYTSNQVTDWINDKLGNFQDEYGNLECDIEVEVRRVK